MEDLSAGRNLDPVDPCPPDVLTTLCTEIGRLYGFTARELVENQGRIGTASSLPKAFTYQTCLMTTGIPKLVKRRWTPKSQLVHKAIMRWGDGHLSILKDDNDIQQAALSLEKQFVPRIYNLHEQIHDYPCVVQGDMHAGNFMLMPDGQVKMFDMQMWGLGHPAEEICYFLASNVEPSDENDEMALRSVHIAMETSSQGIVKYPFEVLKRDVNVCTLHYLAACLARRALIDTPETVAKLRSKLGPVIDGIERVCMAREIRLLKRAAIIWKKDPNFALVLAPKILQSSVISL
jgi:hypothetical protein